MFLPQWYTVQPAWKHKQKQSIMFSNDEESLGKVKIIQVRKRKFKVLFLLLDTVKTTEG